MHPSEVEEHADKNGDKDKRNAYCESQLDWMREFVVGRRCFFGF